VTAALAWALALNVVASCVGYAVRTVSASGAIGGALLGTIIYAAAGRGAWILLFVTLLVASIASRLGLQRKRTLGIAEKREGRRGAANAFANCGLAAAAAVVAATLTPYATSARIVLAAALAAAGSDTVASEIGKAYGRSPYLLASFARVRAGTPGAVSLEGTVAGAVAAIALAALAVALDVIDRRAVAAVVIGAIGGQLVESVVGATVQTRGTPTSAHVRNVITTAAAAAIALALS
jgi:uncharacterized protein (TIGR00297 family)